MSEGRKTLLANLRDTVQLLKSNKALGVIKTEHSIFIPASLMVNQLEETTRFIQVARYINNNPELKCPVLAEKILTANIAGVEFVFQFNESTDFDAIVQYIGTHL